MSDDLTASETALENTPPIPKFKIGEAIWTRFPKGANRGHAVHMVKIHSSLFDTEKMEWVYFGIRSKYPIRESEAQTYPIQY